MLFVLARRDEERTNDIVTKEVKDRKFREEASSRPMPVAIVGRIERARSTFTIRTTFTVCGGGFLLGDPRVQIPKREARSDPRSDGARNTSNFLLRSNCRKKACIFYNQFHGIFLYRLGPSEKTSGPPELIIRRMYTRHKSCICHWRARGRGRRAGIGSLLRGPDQR